MPVTLSTAARSGTFALTCSTSLPRRLAESVPKSESRIEIVTPPPATSSIRVRPTGLLVRDYKGKAADTPVYKFDAALVEQMNATCS